MRKTVIHQQSAALCTSTLLNPDTRMGRHICVLKVRLNHPISFSVGVDEIVDLLIVEIERRCRSVSGIRSSIAASGKTQAVGGIESPGKGTGKPTVAIGIKTIIPTEGGAEFAVAPVHLQTAIDGIFLVPQQPALDVHVLEGEGIFRANQGGQCTGFYIEISLGELQVPLRERAVQVLHGVCAGKLGGPERWQTISSALKIELPPACRLLYKYLGVGNVKVRRCISSNVVRLRGSVPAQDASDGQLAAFYPVRRRTLQRAGHRRHRQGLGTDTPGLGGICCCCCLSRKQQNRQKAKREAGKKGASRYPHRG